MDKELLDIYYACTKQFPERHRAGWLNCVGSPRAEAIYQALVAEYGEFEAKRIQNDALTRAVRNAKSGKWFYGSRSGRRRSLRRKNSKYRFGKKSRMRTILPYAVAATAGLGALLLARKYYYDYDDQELSGSEPLFGLGREGGRRQTGFNKPSYTNLEMIANEIKSKYGKHYYFLREQPEGMSYEEFVRVAIKELIIRAEEHEKNGMRAMAEYGSENGLALFHLSEYDNMNKDIDRYSNVLEAHSKSSEGMYLPTQQDFGKSRKKSKKSKKSKKRR